jgi:hypothetical protein
MVAAHFRAAPEALHVFGGLLERWKESDPEFKRENLAVATELKRRRE